MTIIVSDASVLIDLAKVRLTEAAFALPHDFVISDVLFSDELLDLGECKSQDLLEAGLSICELDSEGVRLAFDNAPAYASLTPNDCFALALAKRKVCALVTGDAALRNAAQSEAVEVHGLLWLCDLMNDYETISKSRLCDALIVLAEDPFVWLPRRELDKRIQPLKN